MSARGWEKRVLATKGAEKRVAEIEQVLLLTSRLTALREGAGRGQRELAKRLGVSRPRDSAIERSHNVTIDVLEQNVEALVAKLDVNVIKGRCITRRPGSHLPKILDAHHHRLQQSTNPTSAEGTAGPDHREFC